MTKNPPLSVDRSPRPARLPVIHVTHEERRRIKAKAARLGWPVAELVRRSVEAYPAEK
jgi:hypothetical protein